MDHPVNEIRAIICKFAHGSPKDQRDAFHAYFLDDSSYDTPLLRVPSFNDVHLPYLPNLPNLNSRFIIRLLYRLSQLLAPTSDLNVHSALYDQKTATLTVHLSETLHPRLIPFYHPTLRSTLIFRLAQRTVDANRRFLPPHDPNDPDALGGRSKLFVAGHERLVQPADLWDLFLPYVGSFVCKAVQLVLTCWLVLAAAVLVPLAGLMPKKTAGGVSLDRDKDH